MQGKKRDLYDERITFVKVLGVATETYGCCSPDTLEFLRVLAALSARRNNKADEKSAVAKKVLHSYRQRWSITLQRQQAITLHVKVSQVTGQAFSHDRPLDKPLAWGELEATIEPTCVGWPGQQ
ncbi:hypothetical protein CLOP_g20877 [Closterium sp. NIES-67]|nr:hypothetical protein CLOP_g20877 [Closterium sp. NIES-67]